MTELTRLIEQHQNVILIAAVLFLAAITLYGHYRGFVRMAVSFGAVIVSFVLVQWMLPFAKSFVQGTGIVERETAKLAEGIFAGGEADYSAFYRALGLQKAAEATGEYLAGMIVNALCFIILFILVNLLLKIAAHFLNTLMKLPILHGTNQLCGAALGFLEGVFYLWVFMIGVAFTPTAQLSQAVMHQVMQSPFLLWVYQNNFLLNIIGGILGMR